MQQLFGILIVLVCVFGGFMLHGGIMSVIWQPVELLIICGAAVGAIVLGSPQLIEWGGAQRWLRAPGDAATAERIRAVVAACGGHATLFRGGDKSVGVFEPLAPAIGRIHERLKAGFDPAGIFNPGRMF